MNKLKSIFLREATWWHIGAISLFLIISCVYFAPALKGYAVNQGDVVNYVGASREIVDYRDNSGEQVLWTNAMFSGMPTTQISMIYDGTWLTRGISAIVRLGLPAPIFFMFVYFLGFYILALSLRIKPLFGVIGALAFGFSSYFIVIIEAGHNTKAAAIGFAPFMIAGFIFAYRLKNWVLGVGLAALFMALELSANHVQITYYMVFVLLLLGLVELYKYVQKGELVKFFKITGLLVLGYALAVMVNYGNLFGTVDYAKQTIRGGTELTITANGESNEDTKTSGLDRDYITNWSYGRAESFSLLVPNFKGGETQAMFQNEDNKPFIKEADRKYRENISNSNQYWGDQPFTSGPVYLGVIVLFLAFLALVYVKDKYKWALFSVALLALMLSWGKNYVSVFVLIPILAYNINIFLDQKKQMILSLITTLILFFGIANGDLFFQKSLTDFFLDYVPGYDKLRAVTIILVVIELAIPILGILFLQRLFKAREEIRENSMGFFIVSGVFLLFLLALAVSPTTFNTFLSAQESASLDTITDPAVQTQYFDFYDALEQTRISIFKADVMRSLGFFVLGAGLIFAFIRTGFSEIILGVGLAVLILFDLMLVDKRYLNNEGKGDKYEQWVESYEMQYPFTAGEGELAILEREIQSNPVIAEKIDSAVQVLNAEFKKDKDISSREKQVRRDFITFRVLNRNTNFRVYEEGNPYNSSYTSYFNKSIGGYHGAKLGRYQELIDFHISKGNPAVVNMLNTKYFLRPERGNNGRIGNTKLTQVNRNAMGNAWFAKEVKFVKDADEEILALDSYNATQLVNKGLGQVMVDGKVVQTAELTGKEIITVQLPGMPEPMPIEGIPYGALTAQPLALIVDSTGLNWIYDAAPDSLFDKIFSLANAGQGGWDPAKTTIVDQRFAENFSSPSYSGTGTIEMTSYHPDRMVYESSSPDKQLAVFSEIYYEDGWKAYVDNEEVPVSRVNYVLRAIEVPAGEHEIRFEFKLESYEKASIMALIGSLAILLILFAGIYASLKESKEETSLSEPFE